MRRVEIEGARMVERAPPTSQLGEPGSGLERKPARPGQTVAVAVMFLLWGAFLYLYPSAALLPPIIRDPIAWVGFGCFLIGALAAAFGVSDLTRSQFVRNLAAGLGLLLVAYVLHLAAARIGLDTVPGIIVGVLAIPFALLGLMGISQSIPPLVEGTAPVAGAKAHRGEAGNSAGTLGTPSTESREFERWASIIVAGLGVIAALIALVKSMVESTSP